MKRIFGIFVVLVAVVVVVACNRDKTESVKTQLEGIPSQLAQETMTSVSN